MLLDLTQSIELAKGEIEGVSVTPLRTIPDERGCIYHGVKASDVSYSIAEVYFKKLNSGVINGWHVHELMTLSYITIIGVTKLVLIDLRDNSATRLNVMELFCGEGNHVRVEIPPGIANASQSVSGDFSLFCNTPNREHDQSLSYLRIDPFEGPIKYQWFQKHF